MDRSPQTGIQPLARELNERIEAAAPEVLAMLSAYGRRLYFPRGILSQSAEASQKAHRFNATIGIATAEGAPMHLPVIQRHLDGLDPKDVYAYAPAAGRPELRRLWREKLLLENPDLAGKEFGQPVVTAAITHGLSLVAALFVDPGDVLLLPDKLWGNYRLNFEVNFGARIETHPFYSEGGFHVEAFARALADAAGRRAKLVVLLNFPNNPTGYMPTEAEGRAIVAALERRAASGTRLVVVVDDAYFGLFYHLGGRSMTQSLFASLVGLHPNLLAVKLDGATKELFVWGLRCGFISVGPGRAKGAQTVCEALDAKLRGAIRGGISNVSQLSQTLVERALSSPETEKQRSARRECLRARAEKVFEIVAKPRYAASFAAYPFNSGYFMCVKVKGVEAERLRVHLLERYGIGLIATGPSDIRVAFSCLEVGEVEPLFDALHEAILELR